MGWSDSRGNALLPALVVIFLVLIAVGVTLAVRFRSHNHVVPVPPGECTCDDYRDMKNRVAEAAAAEAEINNNRIPSQQAADTKAGTAEKYSGATYDKGKADVQTAINAVTNPKARKAKGETKPSCEPSTPAPTACLKAALQVHENIHAASCDAYISQGKKGDWKEALDMVDYWREDAKAYAQEQAYVNNELARLQKDSTCVPVATYSGKQSKEDQKQMLAGAKRRVGNYARTISPRAGA